MPTGTTVIDFVQETFDTNSFHDNSSNPSRLTCAVAGYYRISTQLVMISGSNSGLVICTIRKGGSTSMQLSHLVHPGSTSVYGISCVVLVLAAADDYFEVTVTQTTGQTWATGNSESGSSFSIEKLDGTT